MPPAAEPTVTIAECEAMKTLYAGERTQAEIAELFEYSAETVRRHINTDCEIHRAKGEEGTAIEHDRCSMSREECLAARILSRNDEYNASVLGMIFQISPTNVDKHTQRVCAMHRDTETSLSSATAIATPAND